jgi:hypothetical protein
MSDLHWLSHYNEREQLQINACRTYYEHYCNAGLPGHNLMLLIARMAAQLDAVEMGVEAAYEAGDIPSNGQVPAPPPQQRIQGETATPKQINYIYKVAEEKGYDAAEIDAEVKRIFGVGMGEITKAEASQLIDTLKGK